MKAPGPIILGFPAGVIGRLVGLPPWLAVVVIAASLILGLVHAIVPQDSADRLRLLLALRQPGAKTAASPRITAVAEHVTDDQEQEPLQASTSTAPAAAVAGPANSAHSQLGQQGPANGVPERRRDSHPALLELRTGRSAGSAPPPS